MAANGVTDQYSEVFDAGHDATRDGVHQRIRANSSIMQMRKILGAQPPLLPGDPLLDAPDC